jgi:hypothetical protein
MPRLLQARENGVGGRVRVVVVLLEHVGHVARVPARRLGHKGRRTERALACAAAAALVCAAACAVAGGVGGAFVAAVGVGVGVAVAAFVRAVLLLLLRLLLLLLLLLLLPVGFLTTATVAAATVAAAAAATAAALSATAAAFFDCRVTSGAVLLLRLLRVLLRLRTGRSTICLLCCGHRRRHLLCFDEEKFNSSFSLFFFPFSPQPQAPETSNVRLSSPPRRLYLHIRNVVLHARRIVLDRAHRHHRKLSAMRGKDAVGQLEAFALRAHVVKVHDATARLQK